MSTMCACVVFGGICWTFSTNSGDGMVTRYVITIEENIEYVG